MALQGDLSSFALPDVLRLLAGSGKSGALEVTASAGSGEIWFFDGGIVGGAVSTADHAIAPADVLFELLRYDGGSFLFDDTEVIDEAPTSEVDTVLAEAEALVAEWAEVEAVVPSMDAWVTLVDEVTEDVTLSPSSWRSIAAVGSGGNVRDLADALALTDLAASRAVKELVELGVVEVRASHGYADVASAIEIPSHLDEAAGSSIDLGFDGGLDTGFDPDARYAHHDAEENLAVLRTDERAVVMEQRDDALLPEPLPGEGYAYGDDVDAVGIGSVDARAYGVVPGDGSEPFQPETFPSETFQPQGFEPTVVGEPPTGFGAFPDEAAPRAEFLEDFAASMAAPPAPEAEVADVEPAAPEAPVDDDRGSLLKFLSTVKP